MSTDKKLMKLFLDCPNYIRQVVISDHQISVINSIREHNESLFGLNTRTIANLNNTSIQSMSTQLNKLWKTGYLSRKERIVESGGIEYLYRSVIE